MDAIGEIVGYLFVELVGWAIGKLTHGNAGTQTQRAVGRVVLAGCAVVAFLACIGLQLFTPR